jgi:hypothetical protein
MARLVTSATDILLWEATGLEPTTEEREASEMTLGDLRSATLASTPAAGFGPETYMLGHKRCSYTNFVTLHESV